MQILEPNYKWNGILTNRKRTDTVILHHAEASQASAEDVHRWHQQNGWAGIGYHYYVRKDGSVYRGRPETVIGAHAGSKNDYNSRSIGICFEGAYDTEIMPDKQLAAGKELLRDIMSRYGKLNILAHRDVTATSCPGKNFPMEKLKNYEEEDEMTIYKTLADVPSWGQATVQKLISKGYLSGGSDGNLDLEYNMLRVLVINDRAGLYK